MTSTGKEIENNLDTSIRQAIALDVSDCIPVTNFSPLPERRSPHFANVMRRVCLAAAVVVSVAALGFGTVLAASAELRAQVGGLLIQKDDKIHIHASGNQSILKDAPGDWLGCYWFEKVPEGYKVAEIFSSRTSSVVRLDNSKGDIIWFGENWTGHPSVSYPESFDTDTLVSVQVGDHEGLYWSLDSGTMLMWEVDGCMLTLLTPGTVEDAIQIASLVRPIF